MIVVVIIGAVNVIWDITVIRQNIINARIQVLGLPALSFVGTIRFVRVVRIINCLGLIGLLGLLC